MNPVQVIVNRRIAEEAARSKKINQAIIEAIGNILVTLAESDEYRLSMHHFIDHLPQTYHGIPNVDWNTVIANELDSVNGITVIRDDRYTISTSANNLLEADLDKYFF